jgi:predicted ATPase
VARRPSSLRAPFLRGVRLREEGLEGKTGYPFDLALVRNRALNLSFDNPVTVIVGENGTGKSTLLEAIAEGAGFGSAGGTRDHVLGDEVTERYRDQELEAFEPADRVARSAALAQMRADERLTDVLRFSWLPKVSSGFFFRAETFHRLARYLDEAAVWDIAPGPGPEHLKMSHAEGFIDFFSGRFGRAMRSGRPHLFIFDEPESALSPKRQLEFLVMLRDLVAGGTAQILVATHSPLLMAYPGCDLRRLTRGSIESCSLRETEHFQYLRQFYADPEGFIDAHLTG